MLTEVTKCNALIKPPVKSKISINRIVKKSNTLWEADIKYGYIIGEDKFFFARSLIDVFDRSIIDYYMGYRCTGSDAASLLRRSLLKRNLLDSYKDAYYEVSRFVKRYNTNMIHSSLKYKTPNELYTQNLGKEIENIVSC